MLKKIQNMAISKNFLISLLFVCLIFTTFGSTIGDSYAVDLNETGKGMEIGLDVEDTLENSQEGLVNLDEIQSGNILLSKSYEVKGGTFKDIQNVINKAEKGDEIVLNGKYSAGSSSDRISINKQLTITGTSSAVLDAKNFTQIFSIGSKASGTVIKNIKFINAYSRVGGAIFTYADDVQIVNCAFENNNAYERGGAIASVYNDTRCVNVVVDNCKFINNSAVIAGAVCLYGNNSTVKNSVFVSNSAHNDFGNQSFGGAIQMSMDNPSTAYVLNCIFINNSVYSDSAHTHGGAGCIRDGVIYDGCIFINNSADEGGALTYHASGSISNCIFINNTANEFGGALSTGYFFDKTMDLDINNCSFEGNIAPLGGAVQLVGENIKITDSNFNNNYAYVNGGAANVVATSVIFSNSSFKGNIAETDGGAIFINGKSTLISESSFMNNSAIPDFDKYDEGLGGAIYVNSTNANIENSNFLFNTARNGSAIYYDKFGKKLRLSNNTLYQNQAWVYLLPIFAKDIYYGDVEVIKSIIHGGNNIGKYGDLAVSNAIYNAAEYSNIQIDGEYPVNGATNMGILYQDDREYNMGILLTIEKDDGTIIFNKTLNSNYLGEVSEKFAGLKPGKYYVTARHYEDTYYKAITNKTTFNVIPKVDNQVKKLTKSESYNYEDVVIWTLNITNNGPNDATGVVVRDVLPEGLIWIDDDTNNQYDPVTGILNIDKLDVGETIIVNIYTVVNKTGKIVNNVNVTSNEYDFDLTNNFDEKLINVLPACDLEVIKSVNNTNPNYGDFVNWSIKVRNNGPDIAHNVEVIDVLPKSLIWYNNTQNYNPDTGVWNIGTLNPGDEIMLNIVCKVNSTGIIMNNVSVNGSEFDYDLTNNNDSEIIKVSPSSDLSIIKVSNVSSTNFNQLVKWTLMITNNGPDIAHDVVVVDILPEGFIYIDSILEKGTYSDGVINIGTLSVGEKLKVEIISKVNRTGTIVNFANITGYEYDSDLSNNKDNASVFVNPACDLEVIKSVNNTNPNYGDFVNWSIKVRNNGPDIAHNVEVIDVLPKSLIWYNNTQNYNPDTGVWNIGTLNPGDEIMLNIVCKVNSTGIIMNNVSVNGSEFDYDLTNNNDSEIIKVSPSSDLSIIKVSNVSSTNFNQLVKWTLMITNNGPDIAHDVVVVDILPEGFIYIDSILEKGTYSDGVINIGTLSVGEKLKVEIISKVNRTGTIVNFANITGYEYDSDLSNNKDNASVFVNPACDLEVIKKVNVTNPNYGDIVNWNIIVRNNGPDVAHEVKVIDVLPKSLIWVDDDGNGKYDLKTGIWNIGQLNSNAFVQLNIVTRVNATGVTQNNVSVSGREFDYNLDNNYHNDSIDVERTADVQIIKLVNNTNPNYQSTIKWTLIARNNGPDKATDVYVEDILPKGLILINSSASKGIYDNGIWTMCCLENGDEEKLEIVCMVNKTGVITNLASITADEVDPNLTNNKNNKSISVPTTVDLEVIKQVSNEYPFFGEDIIWFISVKNNGPDDATNVILYDLLDDGLIFNNYSSTVGEFVGGKWVIGQLKNNQVVYLNISCKVNRLDNIVNEAFANSSEVDRNESNNKDDELICVFPVVDLSINKLVNNSNPNYKDLVKWIIIITNMGPNNASDVFIRDILPKGVEFVKSSGYIDMDGSWYAGDLAVGEVKDLEIICKVTSTGNFRNIASVYSNEFDLNPENNEDEEWIFVAPACDLSITKTVSKYNYKLGDVVKYSIKLTNYGPDDAKGVVVNEVLDKSLKLKSFKTTLGSFDKSNHEWSITKLAAGDSAELFIKAVATGKGMVENLVSVTSDTFDYNLNNNKDVAKVNVTENNIPNKNSTNDFNKSNPKNNVVNNNKSENNALGLLNKHVTGNSFVFLALSLLCSIIFFGGNSSKKR